LQLCQYLWNKAGSADQRVEAAMRAIMEWNR